MLNQINTTAMTRRNVTTIEITSVEINYTGILNEWYFDKTLLLRTARKVGDRENVNNTQLGRLNEAKKYGSIDFKKI